MVALFTESPLDRDSVNGAFFIEPEGKIIAKYLRGEELDKKLTEVFAK